MDGVGWVAVGAVAFVGTHFLLSHPLRAPLVRAAGPGGFAGIYSVVAFLTLGMVGWAYPRADTGAPFWPVGDGLWALVSIVMLAASVLLMGSLIRNPALPGPQRPVPDEARGVYAITRHPMLWSFTLWGVCHILVYPVAKNVIVAAAMATLSLVGAALQDRKKAALDPARWPLWQSRTSFWPFAAVAAGRARLRGFGAHTLAGGTLVWLAATWAHIPLAGWRAGVWRWIGS